ncbi:unnamed protein product, partial [Musa textilis]
MPLRLEIKVCGTSSCENFGRICLDLEFGLSPVVTYMQHLNCFGLNFDYACVSEETCSKVRNGEISRSTSNGTM